MNEREKKLNALLDNLNDKLDKALALKARQKMGMTIDIDGSIKELSKWRKDLNYDNGDYCYGDDTTRHSLDVAINIMRKYQRVQEIIKSEMSYVSPNMNPNNLSGLARALEIFREVENELI